MRHAILFLHITLLLAAGFAGCTQKYDDPQDYDFIIETSEQEDGMYVQVTGYRGTKTKIRIPPKFEDYDIDKITDEAFAGKGLTGVVIPDGIRYIERRAFAGNMLISITIPAGITWIGYRAFRGNQ